MKLNTIYKADVKNKYVLVRVDFNVPMRNNKILDDSRIKASIPTIEYLLKKGAIVVLMSHLGRPDGKVVDSLRMDIVAKRLSDLLGKPVFKFDDCIGPEVEDFVNEMIPGEIALLENLRFYKEETDNDYLFAQSLANFSDVFVNDAFSVCHRDHASVTGITKLIPSYAGLLVEKEVKNLSRLENPRRPFTAIIGGVKEDKLDFIPDLLPKVDNLVVGGGIGNIILKVKGVKVGRIKVDKKTVKVVKNFVDSRKLFLPVDLVKDKNGLAKDIGCKTVEMIKNIINKSRTVFWAGPLGVIEERRFAKGTYGVAWALAYSKAFTVVGGGESSGVVHEMHLEDKFSWVSTGGGASIAFLRKKSLPGLKALEKL